MFVAGGKVIPVDVPFTLNGLHFPANWLRLSSEEDKKAAGISWQPDPEPVDQRFYWDHGIAKQLEDQPVVDEKKKPVLDADGNPVIQKGLKSQWIAQQKQTAGTLLASTDWYITRQFETSLDVPAEILDYRAEVRHVSGEREVQIAACKSVGDLAELVTNGGLEEWPQQPE
jgi:hypothetical protein